MQGSGTKKLTKWSGNDCSELFSSIASKCGVESGTFGVTYLDKELGEHVDLDDLDDIEDNAVLFLIPHNRLFFFSFSFLKK